jgi:hypothetical protein
MSFALGVLKWTPKDFWNSGFYEYTAAVKGHLMASGVDVSEPLDVEEVNEAFAKFENAMKARGLAKAR